MSKKLNEALCNYDESIRDEVKNDVAGVVEDQVKKGVKKGIKKEIKKEVKKEVRKEIRRRRRRSIRRAIFIGILGGCGYYFYTHNDKFKSKVNGTADKVCSKVPCLKKCCCGKCGDK